jgi:hypothetical protein
MWLKKKSLRKLCVLCASAVKNKSLSILPHLNPFSKSKSCAGVGWLDSILPRVKTQGYIYAAPMELILDQD